MKITFDDNKLRKYANDDRLAEKKLGSLVNKKIAVLGLAFKPGTDDTRESPAILIIKELLARKAVVFAYDPIVNKKNVTWPLKDLPFEFSESLSHAIENKDACLLVTSWKEFEHIVPMALKKDAVMPLFIDGRGFFYNKNIGKKIKYLGPKLV